VCWTLSVKDSGSNPDIIECIFETFFLYLHHPILSIMKFSWFSCYLYFLNLLYFIVLLMFGTCMPVEPFSNVLILPFMLHPFLNSFTLWLPFWILLWCLNTTDKSCCFFLQLPIDFFTSLISKCFSHLPLYPDESAFIFCSCQLFLLSCAPCLVSLMYLHTFLIIDSRSKKTKRHLPVLQFGTMFVLSLSY
jgi:hypothetical protein